MNICRRIIGEDVPLLDLNGKTGFFAKLFKKNKQGEDILWDYLSYLKRKIPEAQLKTD